MQMYNPTHRFDTPAGAPPITDPITRWNYQFQQPVTQVAVWDDLVYIAVGDSIVAIGRDGSSQWPFQTDGEVHSSPAVVDGTVFVGSEDTHVYALDANTGTQQWCFETGNRVWSSPAVDDETVYVLSGEREFFAINASNGTECWHFQTSPVPTKAILKRPIKRVSSPAVANGVVYIGNRDERVYALDATDGTKCWSYPTGFGWIDSSPTMLDGTVYVGSDDGNVYALDASTDTQQWWFKTDGEVRSSPAVVDSTVFVGSDGGTVYALDGTGTEVFKRKAKQTGSTTQVYQTCPDCEADLSGHDTMNFCPECGAEQ